MNKVILMGRLTRSPEVRYSQGAEPVAVARYTLAVNRRFKRKDEPEADFMVKCGAVYLNSLYDEIGRIWREDFSNCKISALSVIDGNHGIYYAFIVFEEMREG